MISERDTGIGESMPLKTPVFGLVVRFYHMDRV